MAASVTLTACGGGGGSSAGDGSSAGGGSSAIVAQLQDSTRHEAAVGIAQKAARATPIEGSVTQVADGGSVPSVRSVQADASYADNRLNFSFTGLSRLGQSDLETTSTGQTPLGMGIPVYRTHELNKRLPRGTLWVRATTDKMPPTTRQVPAGNTRRIVSGDQIGLAPALRNMREFGIRVGQLGTADALQRHAPLDGPQLNKFLLDEILVGTLNGVRGRFTCPATQIGQINLGDDTPYNCVLRLQAQVIFDATVMSSGVNFRENINFTPGEMTETVSDTDYLVSGTWLFVPDGDDLSGLEIGAFADAPDAELTPSSYLTTASPASYRGKGAGLYLEEEIRAESESGDSVTDRRTGNFDADVILEATFGDTPIIDGRIENITVEAAQNARIPNHLTLARSNISNAAGGFFTGDTSAVALKPDGINTYTYEGKWGGQFYGTAAGYIGGTFGASTADNPNNENYKASFIGTFNAYKNE